MNTPHIDTSFRAFCLSVLFRCKCVIDTLTTIDFVVSQTWTTTDLGVDGLL